MGPLPRRDFEGKRLVLKMDTTIPGKRDAIQPLVDSIMNVVHSTRCAEGREEQVQIALIEALANAVIHGCKENPDKKVEVCVACDESGGMLIIIRDPGNGFDPGKIPSPIEGQNLFETHGRGIFLINQLVDNVKYEKGGTEIHLRIK